MFNYIGFKLDNVCYYNIYQGVIMSTRLSSKTPAQVTLASQANNALVFLSIVTITNAIRSACNMFLNKYVVQIMTYSSEIYGQDVHHFCTSLAPFQ